MASLATLRSRLLVHLVTTADDPLYTTTVLNQALVDAHHSLLDAIQRANPSYFYKEVTLTPDSQTTWTYTFATQSPPITDFSTMREVRKTNEDGDLLNEVRIEELRDAGNGFFTITGPDDAPVLRLSKDTELGLNLYAKYTYWPADMVQDSDSPNGIPLNYHDLLPLEALFVFGFGGESRVPPDLQTRWYDRRAELVAHVSHRTRFPQRTRTDPFDSDPED